MRTTGRGSHDNTLEPATRTPSQPYPSITPAAASHSGAAASQREIPQYGLTAILGVWSAAALPMAALAWLVAPALAHRLPGGGNLPLVKSLLVCLTLGLIWQFLLVLLVVGREQRTLRWSALRGALWLGPPRSPRTGRVGGSVWLVLAPLVLLFALKELLLPSLPAPGDRDLDAFLESNAGQTFLSGNWAWYGLMIVLWIFNTVLGEELLFRGLLLPRMNRVFGRADWVANGVLFAAYHLHAPWSIPVNLLDTFLLSYPAKRYRSAWVGIAVHSAQSLFFAIVVLGLVLS